MTTPHTVSAKGSEAVDPGIWPMGSSRAWPVSRWHMVLDPLPGQPANQIAKLVRLCRPILGDQRELDDVRIQVLGHLSESAFIRLGSVSKAPTFVSSAEIRYVSHGVGQTLRLSVPSSCEVMENSYAWLSSAWRI